MKITSLILTAALAVFTTAAFAAPAFAQEGSSAPHAKKKVVKKKKSLLERVSSTSSKTKKVAKSDDAAQKLDRGQKLSRDIVFDGSNVNGQYHSAGEAVAKVEQEKKLNELTGVRKDFRDRLIAERERLQRNEPVVNQ